MPTVDWNKTTWANQLEEYKNKNLPFYGSQWGNPDPKAVFPPAIRWLIPEGIAAALLQDKARRRWLHKVFKPKAPFYPELYRLIQQYIKPYVTPRTVALEIGPGGGRFTRYLLDAQEIILVDIVPEFFPYIRERFPQQAGKMRFYESSGTELNGIADASVDYLMSFDAFVHIEPDGIRQYLTHIARVLKPGSTAVIHYGDISKEAARQPERSFAPMTAQLMTEFVAGLPELNVIEHDTQFLLHSNLIILRRVQ